MGARLEALPIELLRLIVDFISVNEYKGVWGPWGEEQEHEVISRTLAALACTNRRFNQVFELYLYRWDAKQGYRRRAIGWAMRRFSFGTLERAMAAGFDLNDEEEIPAGWGLFEPPLCRAVSVGREPMLEWLLEHGAKTNPLSQSRVVKGLPYPAIRKGAAALFRAIRESMNEEAAMILLDHGATSFFVDHLEEPKPGEEDWIETALHGVAAFGWTTVLERILEDPVLHDYIDYRDVDDHTPLSIAAEWESSSNAGAMEVLLRHGADPFATFNDVRSPLILAAELGHADHITVLLRYASEDHSKARLFSHQSLWDLMQALDRRIGSFYGPVDCNAILSEFVKYGADFDNPPPPYKGGRIHEPLLTLLAHCLNPIILNTLIDLGAVNPGTKRIQVVQEQDVQRRRERKKALDDLGRPPRS